MKQNILFAVIILSGTLLSCSKDFLDQPYKNGLVNENFFMSDDHANKALTGVYDVLGFEGQYNLGRKALGSDPADDLVELAGDQGRIGLGMIQLDQFNWTGTNTYVVEHWYSCYIGIGRANQVIKYVPTISGMDAARSDSYVAQAKALRALFYFNLVTAFGDVPLLTEPITVEQSKLLTKNPQNEVWDAIISDLTEVAPVLPPSWDKANTGRVTKGFAYGLLSSAYLWTKKYDKAIEAANNVTGYSLWDHYDELFNGSAEVNTETILAVMNATGSPVNGIYNLNTTELNRAMLWGPVVSWSHFMQPSRPFIDTAFEAGDKRLSMILDLDKGEKYDVNGDGVIDAKDVVAANPPVNAYVLKYVPKGVDLTKGTFNKGGVQYLNTHVIRYAEVLLNLAEAYNESNQSEKALKPLNDVRQRAGLLPHTTIDKAELRNLILHERATEFCFEGFRFFDLKRAGRLAEVLGPLGFIKGQHEVFPIPQTEIDLTRITPN